MRFVETIPIAKSSRVGISKEVPNEVSTTHMLEQFIATQAKAIVKDKKSEPKYNLQF